MSFPSNNSLDSCRICLDSECASRITFDCNSDWSRRFEFCVGLQVNEYAPLVFCGNCAKKLEDYEQFKKKCLQSDDLWNSLANMKFETKEEDSLEYLSDNTNCVEDYFVNDTLINSDHESESRNSILTEKLNKHDEKVESKKAKSSVKSRLKECLKCGKKYSKTKGLLHHRKNYCNKNKPTSASEEFTYCGICDFQPSGCANLKQHLNQHYSNNDLNCKLCDYVGRDFADMVTHRHTHRSTKDKQKSFCCFVCCKSNRTLLSEQFHFRKVHLNKPGGFCSVCNKVTRTYKPFRNHERLHKNTGYVCDCCGKKFLFRTDIKQHIREHSNVRNYICETCGKAFKRARALAYHFDNIHRPHVSVVCSHCNKTFKNENTLKIHMRIQTREKKHACSFCSKRYNSRDLLKYHEYSHTGEKPFSCETCGVGFKAKSHLKGHLRLHSGLKPYQCTHCDKSFSSKNSFKRHESVHTGVRSVKCLYCDHTFYSKSVMLAHCNSRHKVNMVKPDL